MRNIEDILKEMDELGLNPENINQEIKSLRSSIKERIVSIDESLTPSQVSQAFEFLCDIERKRPSNRAVSVRKGITGGFVINEGEITKMNGNQLAKKFSENLKQGIKPALEFNQLLCSVSQT